MKITASSPTKVIISGEHAVVHGCTSIAVPLEARNRVTVEAASKKGVSFAAGQWKNEKMQEALEAVYGFIKPSKGVVYRNEFSGMPKGCGNSASIASAFALCLYAVDGREPSTDELFNATQEFEKVMHVNPSGIDARTVLSDSALVMKKRWTAEGVKFDFAHKKLVLPKGTVLLIIDRKSVGEKEVTTGELVTLFSQNMVGKNPNDVTQAERDKMIAPFEPVVKSIISELRENGNAERLGKLFLENNELLAKGGVVPESMKKTVDECVAAGCYGAKGTGACGPGGAVIALAPESGARKIGERLEAAGNYKIIPAKFAHQGPRLERQAS